MTFQILTILVILNLGVTYSLWRKAARKPPRPKKKFPKQLMHSEPITPKHNPPKVTGGDLAVKPPPLTASFFRFCWFADVVNWELSDEVAEDGVMAFTDFRIENLIELIKMHKDDPTLLKRGHRQE